jgi:hypothetical protein
MQSGSGSTVARLSVVFPVPGNPAKTINMAGSVTKCPCRR